MHGLINRSIQCFITDTYGAETWEKIAQAADLGHANFEALLHYEDRQTLACVREATRLLSKPADSFLEDLGTYLVSHPNVEPIRRLLRFGGETYGEFLQSLDEVHEWARLAVPDLEVPRLELHEHAAGAYTVKCQSVLTGFGHVVVGVLRAMADDYGALVYLEHQGGKRGEDIISVHLLEAAYAEGRSFELGARAG